MQGNSMISSYFAGQNHADARRQAGLNADKTAMDLQKLLQDMQHTAQMNPLKMQHQQLQNQGLEAQLPGQQAQSQMQQDQASAYRQTMPGAIAATNSKNQELVDVNAQEALSRTEQLFFGAGAWLGGIPNDQPGKRVAALHDHLRQNGIDINKSPHWKTIIEKTSEEELPKKLMEIARNIALQNPKHQQEMAKVDAQNSGRLAVAEARGEAQVEAATIRGPSRGGSGGGTPAPDDVRGMVYGALAKAKNYRDQYAILQRGAALAEMKGDTQLAQELDAQAAAIKKQVEAEFATRVGGKVDKPGTANNPNGQVQGVEVPDTGRPRNAPAPTPAAGGRVQVISPDGKVGSIPASQLAAALKQGYKKAQ